METYTQTLTHDVLACLVAIIVFLVVLVPITSTLSPASEVQVEQYGVSFSMAEDESVKEYSGALEEGTPVVLADVFCVKYENGAYHIYGKEIDVNADSFVFEVSNGIVNILYVIDGTDYDYTVEYGWMFFKDEEGIYKATSESRNIKVADPDNIYMVGNADFNVFWSINKDNINVESEL